MKTGAFCKVVAISAEIDDGPLIRAYQPDDYEAVVGMFVEAARFDKDVRSVRQVGCPAWVAEADGLVAGFIDIGNKGHLNLLVVRPSYRRAGIASSLMRMAEADARRRGLTRIRALVGGASQPFFERNGFTLTPHSPEGGTTLVRMSKAVVPN